MLSDHLEGWDREGGSETQEGGDMGIYVYIYLIHFVVQQKLTQHCKQLYSNKDVKKNVRWKKNSRWCSWGQIHQNRIFLNLENVL